MDAPSQDEEAQPRAKKRRISKGPRPKKLAISQRSLASRSSAVVPSLSSASEIRKAKSTRHAAVLTAAPAGSTATNSTPAGTTPLASLPPASAFIPPSVFPLMTHGQATTPTPARVKRPARSSVDPSAYTTPATIDTMCSAPRRKHNPAGAQSMIMPQMVIGVPIYFNQAYNGGAGMPQFFPPGAANPFLMGPQQQQQQQNGQAGLMFNADGVKPMKAPASRVGGDCYVIERGHRRSSGAVMCGGVKEEGGGGGEDGSGEDCYIIESSDESECFDAPESMEEEEEDGVMTATESISGNEVRTSSVMTASTQTPVVITPSHSHHLSNIVTPSSPCSVPLDQNGIGVENTHTTEMSESLVSPDLIPVEQNGAGSDKSLSPSASTYNGTFESLPIQMQSGSTSDESEKQPSTSDEACSESVSESSALTPQDGTTSSEEQLLSRAEVVRLKPFVVSTPSASAAGLEVVAKETLPTRRNTEMNDHWALRAFNEWITERNESPSVESCPSDILSTENAEELGKWLSLFVTGVRKKNGDPYIPNSIRMMLFALQRVMRQRNRQPFDFLSKEDKRFHPFQATLDSVYKSLLKRGIGTEIKRAPSISQDEETMLWEKGVLGITSPLALIRAVFYLNSKNFSVNGGSNHRRLKRSQFERGTDFWQFTPRPHNDVKSRSGPSKAKIARVVCRYSGVDCSAKCHVKLLDMYLARLPEGAKSLDCFYYSPLTHFQLQHNQQQLRRQVWYSDVPMGKNRLDRMVREMFTDIGIEGKTNLSFRAAMGGTRKNNEGAEDLQSDLSQAKLDLSAATTRYQHESEVLLLSKVATETTNQRLEVDLKAARAEIASLRSTVAQMAADSAAVQCQLDATKAVRDKAMSESVTRGEEIASLQRDLQSHLATIADCQARNREDETHRRMLHNTIQELKGNIRVFCRVRPFLPSELSPRQQPQRLSIAYPDGQRDGRSISLDYTAESSSSSSSASSSPRQYQFEFDRVFGPSSLQGAVFGEISQLVQSALDGYNVCIFAYGQTGSGKTFTMEGPPPSSSSSSTADDDLCTLAAQTRGMIPRAVEQIFDSATSLAEQGWQYEMRASFVEIYNETLRDLLSNGTDQLKHEIKMDPSNAGEVYITNLTPTTVTSRDQVLELLVRAGKNRAVASTLCNERSSRSHSVFQLRLKGTNDKTSESCHGTLNMIDLAGSERVSQSGSTGERLKEAQNINKSLSTLGNVIMSLANKESHVPYRNSKLTYLLQSSLGGNSKTLMFVNMSPQYPAFQESLCSLRFATKVNQCNIGTARKK